MADPAPLYLAWSTSGEATPAGCDHGASMRPPSRSKNGRSLRLPLQRLRTAIPKDWVRVIAWSLSLAAHKCPVRRRGARNRLVQHRWRLQQQACPNARSANQSIPATRSRPCEVRWLRRFFLQPSRSRIGRAWRERQSVGNKREHQGAFPHGRALRRQCHRQGGNLQTI